MDESPKKAQDSETPILQDVDISQPPLGPWMSMSVCGNYEARYALAAPWQNCKTIAKELTDPTHLHEMIQDLEDYFLAAKVLERVRSGEEEIYSSAQVRAYLGLSDTQL